MNVGNWLVELGFQINGAGYEYRFKNDEIDLQLSAVFGVNRHFVEVFIVDGICKTSRALSQPRTEIPPDCSSKEQVAAIIAFALRSFSQVLRHFKVDLFVVGDANRHLHPMLMQQYERQRIYDSRPHCHVDRDWLVPFRKQLREVISGIDKEEAQANVAVGFDGNVLTFDWGAARLKLPAEGQLWGNTIIVDPDILIQFPKRFRLPTVVVDYWEGYFGLGNRRYEVLESIPETPSLDNNKRD